MKQILSLVSAVLIFAVGCTTFNLQETLKETAVIAPNQAITVLPQGPSPDDMDIAECVSRTVQRTSPSLRFISTQEFRDALFPWFEPGTAPDTLEELALLLNKPLVGERIASLGVRYVIRVRGATILIYRQPFGISRRQIHPGRSMLRRLGLLWCQRSFYPSSSHQR